MKRIVLLSISLFTTFGLSSEPRAQTSMEAERIGHADAERIVHADVVALDQLLVYNRFGSFNPFGMIFALKRDVAKADGEAAPSADECSQELGVEAGTGDLEPGKVMLKRCKRPRPLVLRANVGDILQVNVTNFLRGDWPDFSGQAQAGQPVQSSNDFPKRSFCEEQKLPAGTPPAVPTRKHIRSSVAEQPRKVLSVPQAAKGIAKGAPPKGGAEGIQGNVLQASADGSVCLTPATVLENKGEKVEGASDWPKTRGLSLAIPGIEPLPVDGTVHGACIGMDAVKPGDTFTCRWRLATEGTHLFSSLAAPSGGEGDGGSLSHGLFGALIVEPRESKHYRSQVTRAAFDAAWAPNPVRKHARAENVGGYAAMVSEGQEVNGRKRNVADTRPDGLPNARPGTPNPCKRSGRDATMPVLAMTRDCGPIDGIPHVEIVHGDLNGIIVPPLVDDEGRIVKRDNQIVYERRSINLELTVENNEDERTKWRLLREKTLPFREFVVIFHDELKTFYTKHFRELERFEQFSGIRDGFAINYGASGAGSLVLANRKKIGPAANCPECLYEEFFLESWANGDPALLEAFPDDPSNVHHSYLNDKVVFRNFHAGKETHVFHLHAHQWFAGNDENRGGYLDSQTIGPQQGLTYRIYHGGQDRYAPNSSQQSSSNASVLASKGWWESLGSGNRNRTVGDSIFHCHLYPHFAQGMWALWRVHDVLEDGTRVLPDGQKRPGLSISPETNGIGKRVGTDIETGAGSTPADGTPVPGVVPMPGQAAPLLPTYGLAGNPGYPFFIAGEVGKRAPQPPLDMAPTTPEQKTATLRDYLDGGLPRHVIVGGKQEANIVKKYGPIADDKIVPTMLALGDITAHAKELKIKVLDQRGEPVERRAMGFHHNGTFRDVDGQIRQLDLFDMFGNPSIHDFGTYSSRILNAQTGRPSSAPGYFAVNGSEAVPGAPFADPCGIPADFAGRPASAGRPALSAQPYRRFDGVSKMLPRTLSTVTDQFRRSADQSRWLPDPGMTGFRRYEASAVQMNMVVNRAGWHDPQARINVLTKGSSDWKESKRSDAQPFFFRAFSGECVEFRHTNETPKDLELDDFQLKVPTDTIGQHIHLVKFDVTSADGSGNGFNYEDGTSAPDEILARICEAQKEAERTGQSLDPRIARRTTDDCDRVGKIWKTKLADGRKYFQTTIQRWFADTILSNDGQGGIADRTLRTVFTHDHFAPSNIQQHGFYNALLVEPMGHDVCLTSRPELPEEHGDGMTCRKGPPLLGAANTPMLPMAPPEDEMRLVGARASVLLKERPEESWDCTAEVTQGTTAAPSQRPVALRTKSSPLSRQSETGNLLKTEKFFCASGTNRIVWSSGYGNPIHPDAREYAIAIADFATLYDGKLLSAAEVGQKVDQPDAKGLDRLVREMRCKFDGKDRDGAPAEYEAPLEVPSAAADRCIITYGANGKVLSVKINGTVLASATSDLTKHLEEHRTKFGRAVAPPFRPEAISQKHHDPYLVNYRNEPIPLRIGYKDSDKEVYNQPCHLKTENDRKTANHGDIKEQRSQKQGDMGFVFSSNEHKDPCTPILESYDDERVSVRLIQGAQEVQHTLTVAGQVFRRHVDQSFPAAVNMFDEREVRSRAALCASNPVQRAGRPRQAFGWEHRYLPLEVDHYWSNYKRLIEHCENPSGAVAAQEIGISEHFELNSTFDAGRVTRLSRGRVGALLARLKPPQEKSDKQNVRYFEKGTRPVVDHHYSFGSQDALWNGAWGLVRTFDTERVFDWTACMEKPGESAKTCSVAASRGSPTRIEGRVPTFAALRGQKSEFDTIEFDSPQPTDLCRTIFSDLPNSRIVKAVAVVARRRDLPGGRGVTYRNVPGGRMFDPDGIVVRAIPFETLFPSKGGDERFATQTLKPDSRERVLQAISAVTEDTPYVLRVRAGDCLQLWTVNLLPQSFAQFSPRVDGDARMPLIVPLNSGVERIRSPNGPSDVKTSSFISLAIPLLPLESRRETGFAVGLNSQEPLKPGQVQVRQYYAGVKREPDLIAKDQDTARVGFDVVPYAFGALPIRAMGDVVNHPTRGLIGSVVVEPAGDPQGTVGPTDLVYYNQVVFTNVSSMGPTAPATTSPGVPDTYTIPAAQVRSHTLFWQDGLNLWHSGTPIAQKMVDLAVSGATPIPDCRVCDDSYDYGEKGVSFRSEPFVRRMAGKSAPPNLGATDYPDDKTDLNKFTFGPNFFSSSSRYGAPATPKIYAGRSEQTVIRVVHAGGRARQRAFVLYGAGYNDLFPGFGSPHSSLLAPGKAVTTAFCTPEHAIGEFMYRDGPQPLFASGVWGLIHVDGRERVGPSHPDKCVPVKVARPATGESDRSAFSKTTPAPVGPLRKNLLDSYKSRGLP